MKVDYSTYSTDKLIETVYHIIDRANYCKACQIKPFPEDDLIRMACEQELYSRGIRYEF